MGIRIQPRDIDISEGNPFEQDQLDRKEAVYTLTHLVGNIEGPCVLAVDAPWGAGKTTFLRIWTQHLRNRGFPVVEFNAWETDFSEEPFVILSSELTEGLRECAGKPLSGKIDAISEAAKDVLRRVAPGVIRLAAGIVPIAGPELGVALESYAKEKLSQHQEARKSVAKFKHVLQGLAAALSEANGNHPLMVVIDELDRCRPSYAVELLEVAKHLFSVDGIVFVLAVNRSELANSVRALYGSGFDAEGYLRRFFDVDFVLPEPKRSVFINELLRATQIDRCYLKPESSIYSRENFQNIRTMLLEFFDPSDLSLRTVAQAVHRLGLLFASLRSDELDHALATTVALILRTIDPNLYHRFNRGDATDLDVVNAVFDHPGRKALQYEERGEEFEAAIVLAALEDDISKMSSFEITGDTRYFEGPIRTPLLDWYQHLPKTEREVKKGGHHKFAAHRLECEHATRVFKKVMQEIQDGRGQIGFCQAVRRLELLSDTLIDKHPDPPSTNS